MVLTIDLVLEELTSLVDPNIPEIHFYVTKLVTSLFDRLCLNFAGN